MKKKITIEETVEVLQDYEISCLKVIDSSQFISLPDLVERSSGVDAPTLDILHACEYSTCDDAELDTDRWRRTYNEYVERSGRRFPPLYKVRITLEAEELSPAELRYYWESKQERMRRSLMTGPQVAAEDAAKSGEPKDE